MRLENLETRCVLAASFGETHVAVLFTPSTTATEIATATATVAGSTPEKIVLHAAPESYGQLYRFSLRSGVTMATALAALRSDSHVKLAEADQEMKPADVSNDPLYLNNNLWGMYSKPAVPGMPQNQYGTQADTLWADGITGSNTVVVGILDTGIDISHPDLAPNIWTNPGETPNNGIDDDSNGFVDDVNGWDFANNDKSVFDGATPGDGRDEHGTHVAGTIGAKGRNAIGVAGVNWNVKIIPAKFLDPFGALTDAVRALDYFTALKNKGVNIVATNHSWGGGGFSQLLLDAIGRSAQAKMLFFAAAGNANSNNDLFPEYPTNYNTTAAAGYDAVVSVAAIDRFGNRATFSSYGATTVDLGAPGVAVVSTLPFNSYGSFNGTSMAAPHVTGAAAIYASMNPGATPQQIRAAILGSAIQTPTASLSNRVVTNGRLNLTKMIPVKPKLSISDASIIEGDYGTSYVSLTISSHLQSEQPMRVNYATANGSALEGSDYAATSGFAVISPGQTTVTIQVPIYGDLLIENTETFRVNLTNPINAELLDPQANVQIRTDDFASQASVSDIRRLEGNVGTNGFVFNITLSEPSALPVTLSMKTVDGSAKAGSDHGGFAGDLIFAPGETSKSVTVLVLCETLFEPDETFYLDIASATNASIKGRRGTATILNDDSQLPGTPPGSGGGGGGGPGDTGSVDPIVAAAAYYQFNSPTTGATTTQKKK